MNSNLNATIARMLASLREKKGSVSINELKGILESINSMLAHESSAIEIFLRDEIINIANHIEVTKNEIVALSPDTAAGKEIDSAAMQLDAVLKATEEAAQIIIDTANEIEATVTAAGVDAPLAQKITQLTTRIYEACNFQDLNGQRITKVMQALDFIESRIHLLVSMFASDGSICMEKFRTVTNTRENAHLLNGPQLPGSAPSQSEIDALFANLK